MKKRIFILVIGFGLVLGGCSWPFGRKSPAAPTATPQAEMLTAQNAPFTTLSIEADKESGSVTGHTFKMQLQNLEAAPKTLEYLILYNLPDGRQQGIPGTIHLTGSLSALRENLLMGSCSQTCRYDQGVTKGTIELTYRDSSGATLGDVLGDWHLQNGGQEFTSVDNVFVFEAGTRVGGWFVTMNSLGLPATLGGKLVAGPYVVTSTGTSDVPGTVSFNLPQPAQGVKVYLWSNQAWQELTSGFKQNGQTVSVSSPSLGTFAVTSS